MIDRKTLRLSAVLLVVGFILYVVVGLLHPDGPGHSSPRPARKPYEINGLENRR